MARSWERMVQRNTQQMNKQRKKQGKEAIHASKAPGKNNETFKGRNIALPILLVVLGSLFWMIGSVDQAKGNGMLMNWLGVVLYYLLAALLFFRRPYLKVESARLSTIKFNRERFLTAANIEKIILSNGAVVIKHKGTRSKWAFSKFKNRYDVNAMGTRLEAFAKANHIEVVHA